VAVPGQLTALQCSSAGELREAALLVLEVVQYLFSGSILIQEVVQYKWFDNNDQS
jgi:hypothetical protein